MDVFLGQITHHAMTYAIRSGIAITSTYAIRQCSRLLKTVDDNGDFAELQSLQERLDSKIRIISPAIDMIELISARGNTSLESAVSLTKSLRWDIQNLGVRISKAASAEEAHLRSKSRNKERSQYTAELHGIIRDIKRLLARIEDAVPLINLAITTSGANLSTTLPPTVSPSRLLQASTLLTAGDSQFSMNPNTSIQVGPNFTLSVYMVFAGHSLRSHEEMGVRETTWKEVIHKCRLKLVRKPFRSTKNTAVHHNGPDTSTPGTTSVEPEDHHESNLSFLPGEEQSQEYSYELEMIEDLEDDRVHSYDDPEMQPAPYKDVPVAGIRESIPIYQVSKIFYADTGKILNIGSVGETNNPVLLLKRDVNAMPPRQMMDNPAMIFEEVEHLSDPESDSERSQADVDEQLRRESSIPEAVPAPPADSGKNARSWKLPSDLDPEWIAFEVYTESAEDSSDGEDGEEGEEGEETVVDSAKHSEHSSVSRQPSLESTLFEGFAKLDIKDSPPIPASTNRANYKQAAKLPTFSSSISSPYGPVRSSLSLLEMLIRLTALQQFQQGSHLAIPDELLTFFLEESSTTGAGGDSEMRRRKRLEARQRVGFDPYDESPIKRRGEDYQYRGNTYDDRDSRSSTPYAESPSVYKSRERSLTPQDSSETWLFRGDRSPRSGHSTPDLDSSSRSSPYMPPRRPNRPLERVRSDSQAFKGSPLGRGASVETDSTLGTSPSTPALNGRKA